jgi:hypothetical protein
MYLVAGADICFRLLISLFSDFGWTGWEPANEHFCNNVMPVLQAQNLTIPRSVQNDCDAGDRSYLTNATALQGNIHIRGCT